MTVAKCEISHIISVGTAGNMLTTVFFKNGSIAATIDFKEFDIYPNQ